MRVVLFETVDVTSQVIEAPAESAGYNNVDGLLAPVRQIVLQNSDGLYSPNSTNSLFSDDAYRNKFVEIFDDADNRIYKGLIQGIDERIAEDGQHTVTIRSRDALGSFLDWPVSADQSIEGITTNASRTAGQNTLQIPDTVPIAVGAVVSTSPAKVPSYLVTAVSTGGGNQTLTLDRGLEADLGSGADLFFSLPKLVTIPKALKDALFTPLEFYGLASLIGTSFDMLDLQEQAAGHLIRQFVRREEGIELSKHIGKLLELGGYNLTRSEGGVFEIIDSLAYDGRVILDVIEDADIIGPVESEDDDSRLLYAFSMLYIDGTSVQKLEYDLEYGYGIGAVPQFEPGLTPDLIEKYGARKVYKPITANSSTVSGYNYLYADIDSARYYGLKALNYNAYKRVKYRLGVKPFKSGDSNSTINLSYFKPILLTMRIDENQQYINEPAVVLSYDKDPASGAYRNVVIELTNKPTPGLPVN